MTRDSECLEGPCRRTAFNYFAVCMAGSWRALSFKALGPTSAPSYGNYLDNVVVTGVPAVPEAGSFGMLAIGLAFVTYVVRRRRR